MATGYFRFLRDLVVANVDQAVAQRAASVGSWCRLNRVRLPTAELHLVATALERQFTLVTYHTAYYGRIPGLSLADWSVP